MSVEIRLNGGREIRIAATGEIDLAVYRQMATDNEKGVPCKLVYDHDAGVLIVRMEGR
jgi:hypothetical protein